MVIRLIFDVTDHGIHTGLAHRKCAVPILPIKIGIGAASCLGPFGGALFDFFQQIHKRDFARERTQDMHMIVIYIKMKGGD